MHVNLEVPEFANGGGAQKIDIEDRGPPHSWGLNWVFFPEKKIETCGGLLPSQGDQLLGCQKKRRRSGGTSTVWGRGSTGRAFQNKNSKIEGLPPCEKPPTPI